MSPRIETSSTPVFVPGFIHPNAAQGQLGLLNPKPQRCSAAGHPKADPLHWVFASWRKDFELAFGELPKVPMSPLLHPPRSLGKAALPPEYQLLLQLGIIRELAEGTSVLSSR